MAMIYRDSDANLGLLMDKQITVLGYGNMGHSFALNLRDSAFPVLIGNRSDEYAEQAYRDGFEVASIADTTTRSNIILVMLPDEIAPKVAETLWKTYIRSKQKKNLLSSSSKIHSMGSVHSSTT